MEYQNEFQAAFDLSRIEYQSGDETKEMDQLYRSGKAVVFFELEVCCKMTDALLAVENHIAKIFDSWEAAANFVTAEGDAWGGLCIYAPHDDDERPEIPAITIPEEDIPF